MHTLTERPVVILPSLVRELGPSAAIALQELSHLCRERGKVEGDVVWVRVSHQAIGNATGMGRMAVARALAGLAEAGKILRQPAGPDSDRRCWYGLGSTAPMRAMNNHNDLQPENPVSPCQLSLLDSVQSEGSLPPSFPPSPSLLSPIPPNNPPVIPPITPPLTPAICKKTRERQVFDESSEPYRISKRLWSGIREHTIFQPDESCIQRWATDIDKLIRVKLPKLRDPQSGETASISDLEDVVDYVIADSTPRGAGAFCWLHNVRSGAKLYQHFERLLQELIAKDEVERRFQEAAKHEMVMNAKSHRTPNQNGFRRAGQ